MAREGVLVENPYGRLSQNQIQDIHETSLQILEDPGLLSFNHEASDIFDRHGADVKPLSPGSWRVRIPEGLVAGALEAAPKTVELGARNPANRLIMNGDEPRVFFVTGSETNIWLDTRFDGYVKKSDPSIEVRVPEFHRRRGTVADLCQSAHLCEHLDTVDAFIRTVNIQDKDISLENKDVNKYFASLDNTTKHVMSGLTHLEQLDNLVRMAEIIAGGEAELRRNPIISFITCLVKSPLQFVEDSTQAMIEICRKRLPVAIASSPQGGTTAPITEYGITAQINAEVLAGITLSQLVSEGAPILYGSVPVRARLDNLYDSYGAPESSQYNIDCVQLARYYRLPCYSTSGVSDAKTPGLQSTVERLFSDILVTLSGPQYLHCAYGLFDGNSTFSPLQAVLDDAHFEMIKFFLRSPELAPKDREASLKQIREVVNTPQKLYISHIRPMLRSGRLSMPYPFEDTGEGDEALERANDRMEQILAKPVNHIDEETTARVFEEIPGLLSRLNTYSERIER